MPRTRLSMRQIKEVLRLRFVCERSQSEIARTIGASKATVWEYLDRARRAQVSYERATAMDDAALEALLFPPAPPSNRERPKPEWPTVHRELGKKGVTLDLLWNEYKAQEADGYGYSWFCEHYERWAATLPVTLRQTHAPGEKLFVDYSGNKLGIVDPHTGEIREAELFVATLGASNYTYAEATWSQQLEDWIGSHVRAFTFLGGCVEIVVPDNLKSGVHKPDFYDPILNRTYGEMAAYYGVAIIPARSRRPRDKAKVEQSVLLVQRWILARLRHQRLFSLDEANRAIATLLVGLNNKPFKKLPGCRRSAFEELDRPALRPLPERPYQFAQWKLARVGIDYHVEVVEHFYSVPYRYAREQVDVRYTRTSVEIFHRGQRIAAHARSERRGHHSTIAAHMPPNHRAATTEWNPQRLLKWAASIGPHTAAVVEHLLSGRQHPEQAYRACLGVLRLGKDYGATRLEAACSRAIDLKASNYRFIASTLKNGLESKAEAAAAQAELPLVHANVRGPSYYH
ncbi:IS21 family transposase [Burkholderia ubonensis]|uniref:Integrase n=4 Tax=Burkholderia ubonensis TaxID=101571 RepID=A0AA40RCN3_9BURK|nr:IS21 family transposase [Burkholderia ubonensis]KVR67511.1 integrase [Burkholderia ubonensis]KVZ52665.1 integrase [Burkholderia ubonensis]KWZ52161.1 integrase [Burkholderia ubonensis]KWZ52274.1 integrase [Burkholderia ubonensis]KWZ53114.1 integrase [Burkholderia ubonensis]